MQNLTDPQYLSFPFVVNNGAPKTSGRQAHVREQIEQVLFTNPKERVFRPDFGAGARQLIFEPNNKTLRENLRRRLSSALADALLGEVDPRTLNVTCENNPAHQERLIVVVEYQLATINRRELHRFDLTAEQNANG